MESASVTNVVAGLGRGRGRGRGRLLREREQVTPSSSNVSSYKVNSEPFQDAASNRETYHLVEENGVIRKQRTDAPSTGSNNKTKDCDQTETLITPSSDLLSVSTIASPTDPKVSSYSSGEPLPAGPMHTKYPLSYFLPKYFQAIKPTKRLIELESSPVKILKVLDDRKSVYVAFQDIDSLERFNCLLEKMGGFYSSPQGFAFLKPAKFVENGEIVAAKVSIDSESETWRRVKVQRVHEGRACKGFKAYAIDIDNLSHWNVTHAFSLYGPFYDHPVQPRFIEVMSELSHKILMSMIGRSIKISNILDSHDKEILLTAEISLDLNWRLRSLYLEFFKEYFTPPVPEDGGVYHGTVTDVLLTDKTIGICLKDSLYEPIDRILHKIDLEKIRSSKDEILTAINTTMCKQFIGFNDDKSKLCRLSVKSFYGEKLKVLYLDTARETLMNVNELICSMSDNTSIPSVLSLVPAQALRFQLTGNQKVLRPEECQSLYGKDVYFKVSKSSNIRDSLLEAEILDDPVQVQE